MEVANHQWVKIPLCWCCSTLLCWWYPMIAFFAAANVLETCEHQLGVYLQVSSLICLIIGPAVQTMIVAFAYFRVAACFKLVEHIHERLHAVTCVLLFALLTWGWVAWAVTSDAGCYDGQSLLAHYINPRTMVFLLLLLLTAGFVLAGGAACALVGIALQGEDVEDTA